MNKVFVKFENGDVLRVESSVAEYLVKNGIAEYSEKPRKRAVRYPKETR